MKTKNLLLSVVLLVMLCLVLSVSCSDNIIDEASDTLVYATFDNRSRATSTYTQTITLKDIGDVYWTYTATKADNAGQTGATTAQTAVKSGYSKGLDGAIGPFSQGLWNFEVFGYATTSDTAPSSDYVQVKTKDSSVEGDKDVYYCTKIYYGKVTGVELKNGTQTNPDPINVIINLLKEGKGTFAISSASDFHWNTTGGNVHEDADTSNNTGAIDMYLKLEGRPESSRTDKTDYIKLSFVTATDTTTAYYKIADGETISWSNTDATDNGFTLVASVVRAEATTSDSVTTYQDLNTYVTSSKLFVKVYTGQTTTLEAKVIEGNFAYGEFNGTINSDGAITTSTVKTVVDTSDTVLTSSVSPASASESTLSSDSSTTVTIPSTAKDFTAGSTAALTVTAYPIIAANSMFTISGDSVVVGGIDLTATVTTTTSSGDSGDTTTKTETVDKFTNSDGNAVAVTVETYIAKGLTNVGLTYTKDGTTETWRANANSATEGITAPSDQTTGVCYYNSSTGQLVFATNHFSTFLVGADEVAYVKSTNTAYKTLQEAINATTLGDTVTLLKDIDLGKNSSNRIMIGSSSSKKELIIDMNGKTIEGYTDTDGLTDRDGTPLITVENANVTFSGTGYLVGNINEKDTIDNVTGTRPSSTSNEEIYPSADFNYYRSNAGIIFVKGSNDSNASDYSVVTLGKNITMKDSLAIKIPAPASDSYNYGIVINLHATIDLGDNGYYGVNLNGTNKKTEGNVPEINIEGATITVSENNRHTGIFASGYAKWNIKNSSVTGYETAMEVRAGIVNLESVTFESLGSPSSVTAQGSGTTSEGIALSVAQHNSKLPINVTISSGNFKGYCALSVMNPQKNAQEDCNNVSVKVTGGTFTSTGIDTKAQVDTNYFTTTGEISNPSTETPYTVGGKYKVGSIITMGTIPSDHSVEAARGKDVEWRVLDVEENKVLVISENVLETRALIDSPATSYSWANSSIRTYLNGDFITKYGLSGISIAEVTLETEEYGNFTNLKKESTADKVFLLSLHETLRNIGLIYSNDGNSYSSITITSGYFDDCFDLIAYDLNGSISNWWVRTPSYWYGSSYVNYASYIYQGDGTVTPPQYGPSFALATGTNDKGQSIGIRPAFWFDASVSE